MIAKSHFRFSLVLIILGCISSCSEDAVVPEEIEQVKGCTEVNLMESFTDTEGNNIFIYEDGGAYLNKESGCEFELQYFDPDFKAQNYLSDNTGTFLLNDGEKITIKNEFEEVIEEAKFMDLFKTDINDSKLFWSSFTLQSPQAKTVSEYVDLSKCILAETCDFLDNRIDVVEDPDNSSNQVIRFECLAPTSDMVTAKCSLSSVLTYFEKGDDVWFEADYRIESGMPFSLVDFESSYFEGAPGPRVVINNAKLELDNKFGAKLRYDSTSETTVPLNQWFKIKVHLKYSNTSDGVLELWQDGEQLISATGINMQTSNGIQNILEVGISATQGGAILLMDNIRVSATEF